MLLNLLNLLQKSDKCSASLAFCPFPSAHLINSLKHEHLLKILYLFSRTRVIMILCLILCCIYKFIFFTFIVEDRSISSPFEITQRIELVRHFFLQKSTCYWCVLTPIIKQIKICKIIRNPFYTNKKSHFKLY